MIQMKYQSHLVYAHGRQRAIEEFVTRSSFINWLSVMSARAAYLSVAPPDLTIFLQHVSLVAFNVFKRE